MLPDTRSSGCPYPSYIMPTKTVKEPRCPDCMRAVVADHRFCHGCGAQLRPDRGDNGERRLLTAVRCRSVLPTPSRPDEAVDEVAARFLDQARSEVGRFDGVIVEQSGSGFLAVFGVPIPHEDHARRATLAALALRNALVEGAEDEKGQVIVACFGVSTGEAVVTLAGARVVSVVGRPADDAAVLAERAEAGQILLDAATEEAVSGYIACRATESVERDGERSSPVFSAEGEGPRVSRLDRPDRRVTRFVGRQRQLTTLGELLEEAHAGRGQVVGVAAEAGMGKSRLVAEFLATSAKDARVREGRCLSYAGGTPFVPIVDLLRAQIAPTAAARDASVLDAVRRRLVSLDLDPAAHAAYLANLLGSREGDDILRERSPEAIREGTFQSLVMLFVAEAAEAPTIFVIEDLHWVDPVSQDVIARLVESLPGRRAMLLCTYRPGYQAPWMDVSYATQLTLPPLNPAASRELVESIVGGQLVSKELLDAVVVRADGNPFFLEELGYGLAGGAVETGAVPATVHDVLAARIDQLDGPARSLLRTAAVLGREFQRELLKEIWDGDGHLETLLDELRRKEFLFEEQGRQPPTLLFRHALTHDVAYAGLLTTRRRELHRAAGEALEWMRAEHPEEVYGQLGYHFSRAGEHAPAVRYLALAADRALQVYSNESAAEMLELALRHVEESGDADLRRQAAKLVFRLAFTFHLLGRFRDGLERLESPLAEPDGRDRDLVAEHEFLLAYFHTHFGNSEAAHRHANRAIEEAERLGDAFTVGRAYYVLTREDFWLGRYAQGVEHARRAVELLEGSDAWWWWLGHASTWEGFCQANRGEFEEALRGGRRMNQIGLDRQDPRLQSYSEWNMGWWEATRGNTNEAILHCTRSLQSSPDPLNSAYSTWGLGFAYREAGDYEQAVAYLEQVITVARDIGYVRLVGWQSIWLAEAYLWSGRRDDAARTLRLGLDAIRGVAYPWAEAIGERAAGRIAEADGDLDEAAARMNDALQKLADIDSRFDAAATRLDLARVATRSGDRTAARAHAQAAVTEFRAMATPVYEQRALAMLAELDGVEREGFGPAPVDPEVAGQPLRVKSLGGFAATLGDVALRDADLGGGRGRELLAALVAARAPVHRDRLIGWLWPGLGPSAADEALRATAASVANVIGRDRIATDGPNLRVALGVNDTWDIVDLLVRGAGRGEVDGTVEALTSALAEYAAPPFPEWPDAEWAAGIRRECADALRRVRGRLAEALLADDRPEEALPHFAQLVEIDREEEAWHRGLMRCHARVGDIALALRQFHVCRSIVRQTHAADPSPETHALYLELLARK